MGDLNYNKDLKIEADALDVEWVRQPELFMRYSEHCARSRTECDKAKEQLDVVRAEADLEIRSKYEKKPSEAQIANEVLLHPKVRGATEAWNQAKHQQDLMLAAVRAFDQRKSALENLVRLAGQGYYAGPQVGAEELKTLSQRIAERQQDNREGANEKLRTRRRRV